MDALMRAMVLEHPGQGLRLVPCPVPRPGPEQILIAVEACGVCRTDLHLVDGELPDMVLPMTPGHEIVGRVAAIGAAVDRWTIGQRVGVPWLGWTCGACRYCRAGQENLCTQARFTGYQIPGGFAQYTLADQRYCFALPEGPAAEELAPLLCAALSAGCGVDLRTGRQSGPDGPAAHQTRWLRGVRWHPHERYPLVPVRTALGRESAALGRQPDQAGWRGVLCAGGTGAVEGAGPRLCAGGRQPGAGSLAPGRHSGRCSPVHAQRRAVTAEVPGIRACAGGLAPHAGWPALAARASVLRIECTQCPGMPRG